MGVLSTLGRLFPGFNPAARTAVTAVQPATPTRDDDRPRRSYGEKVPAGYGIGTNITFLPYVDSATADTAAIRDAMRQMLRDPWVKAAWTSQVFAVASQDHAVTPHDKKDANAILQAEFTRHWIEELPGGISGLAMTIAMPLGPDGISVVEPVNAPPAASGRWAGKVMPSKCVARDVNHIRLIGDRFRNIITVKATREPTQPEYPAGDFVITQYMPVFGEPFGTAAFRASYSAYWMLDTIRKLRALHHEKRTKGRIVGTYDANSPDEKDQLEAALRQLSSSDFAVVPEGVKIEAIAMTTANETDYKSFEQDKQTEIVTGIALASLQILQGNVTDARGDTGVQQETSQLGTWYLQRLVEEAVKQLVKLYIDLNFPSPAGYPKVTLGQVKQSEAKAFLDTIEQAQRLGFDDIDRKKVAEFASLPLATDDADKLKPKPPGGGADPFGGMFGGGGPPPAPPSPGAPPEPMLGDPTTFSEQPYQSFAWSAAKTRTGGTKAVGTGRDTGRTLYGKAAAAALAAGGHKADHEAGKEYDSHRDRRAALESRRKRASELTQKLVSYNATPEEHKELVEHLPSLTRKQLSSVRERLMARFGGDTTLAGRVEKLKAHIAERAALPTGDTRPEDGRAVALEKRGEKAGVKPPPPADDLVSVAPAPAPASEPGEKIPPQPAAGGGYKKSMEPDTPKPNATTVKAVTAAAAGLRKRNGLPDVPHELQFVPLADIKPSQTGEDYLNASSRELAKKTKGGGRSGRAEDHYPVVLDEAGRILDGNHRHAAATLNGQPGLWALVPKERHATAQRLVMADRKPENEETAKVSPAIAVDKPAAAGNAIPVQPQPAVADQGGGGMQATTKEPWQMTKNEYQKELHMPFDGVRNSSEGGVNYIATPETLIADEVLAHLYDGGSMSDVDATADDIRNDQTTSAAHKRAILAAVELAKQHYANTKGLRGRERSTADGRFKAELNKEFPVERRGDKHKAAVNAAIEAGQAVPADVLADYPDLAAKYAGRQGGR